MGLSPKSNYEKKIISCFDIGEVPRSPRKWNWNWLYFLPFIFTFEQGDLELGGTASVFHIGDNLNSDHCLHFPSIGHGNILHGSISFDLNSVQDCPRPFDFWTIFLVRIFLGKMSRPWTMSMQVSEHTDQSLH